MNSPTVTGDGSVDVCMAGSDLCHLTVTEDGSVEVWE